MDHVDYFFGGECRGACMVAGNVGERATGKVGGIWEEGEEGGGAKREESTKVRVDLKEMDE